MNVKIILFQCKIKVIKRKMKGTVLINISKKCFFLNRIEETQMLLRENSRGFHSMPSLPVTDITLWRRSLEWMDFPSVWIHCTRYMYNI